MDNVNSGSTEPFIIYRDSSGWHNSYTQNQFGEEFDWVADVKERDPLALTYKGADFSEASFPIVYDDVLRDRIRAEYQIARSSGRDNDNLHALVCFFNDKVGEFPDDVTDYLTTLERPLAALVEMTPYNLATDYEAWEYNRSMAKDLADRIEYAVGERLHTNDGKTAPEKRNIEGYEEKLCIQLAGKYVILAENPAVSDPYLVCTANRNNPFGIEEYSGGIVSDDYVEAMREFLKRADGLAETLEAERRESGPPVQKLTAADCMPKELKVDWEGKLLIVNPDNLAPEYRSAQHQLVLCMGGFGSKPDSRGNAVYVKELYSGKEMRYEKYQIAGLAAPDKLPDWAWNKLKLETAIKEPGVFEYGGYHFKPDRQFHKGEVTRRLKGDSRPWKTDAAYAMQNMSSDFGLGLSKYDWKKAEYSYEGFYTASGNSEANIFKCVENGRYYVPHENELFQYKVLPMLTKSADKKAPHKKASLMNRLNEAKTEAASLNAERKDSPKAKKRGDMEVD